MRKTGKKVLAYGLAFAMMMSVSPVSAAAKPVLNAKTKTIAVGDKTTLSVKNTTKKATYKWTSANKKVATVTKSGLVTGQKAGTTTVTCTVKQGKQSTKLTAKITVLKVKNGGTKTVTAGETAALKVTQYKGAKYTWRSTDTSIVTVNSKGVVTGQKAGTAVVRVRVNAPETRYVAKYTIKVNAEKKVVNQAQLNKALKNKKLTSVVIDTKKNVDLTIPSGDYKNASLTVNAPNADITNNGVFKLIRIKMIKPNTWHENAKGNRIAVTAKNANIVVEKDGSVDAMSFNKKGADVKVRVEGTVKELKIKKENTVAVTANGTIGKVSVSAPSNIKLDGTTKESIPVVVDKTAAGAKLDTAVKVAVETGAKMDIAFQKGSEGSAVKTSDSAVEVAIDNKSDAKVDVTTPSGTQEVEAGQSGSTTGGSNIGDSGNGSTTDGSNTGGSGNGSTTDGSNTGGSGNGSTTDDNENNNNESYTIEVNDADKRIELTAGETKEVTVQLKDKDGKVVTGAAFDWESNNTEVATVEKDTISQETAKINAVGQGKAKITVTYAYGKNEKAIATIEIAVVKPQTQYTLVPFETETDPTIYVNGGAKLLCVQLKQNDKTVSGASIQWSGANDQVIFIMEQGATTTTRETDENGISSIYIAAEDEIDEEVVITATYMDGEVSVTVPFTVTVEKRQWPEIQLSNNVDENVISGAALSFVESNQIKSVSASAITTSGVAITAPVIEGNTIKVSGGVRVTTGNALFVAFRVDSEKLDVSGYRGIEVVKIGDNTSVLIVTEDNAEVVLNDERYTINVTNTSDVQ